MSCPKCDSGVTRKRSTWQWVLGAALVLALVVAYAQDHHHQPGTSPSDRMDQK